MNLILRGIRIDWDQVKEDDYIRELDSLKDLNSLNFDSPITFFVGENGSGKSTLLEAIAIAYGFNPEGGTRNYNFSTYDSHSNLSEAICLIKGYKKAKWGYFLRAESFYNVASMEEEINETVGKSNYYHKKSHGESFLSVLQHNMEPNSLYILDEPEAALSIQRQLTLLTEMVDCVKQGCQFIVVTHSPILLGIPGAQIFSFDGRICPIEYEDTDSYKLTELFINHRERLLKELFEEV